MKKQWYGWMAAKFGIDARDEISRVLSNADNNDVTGLWTRESYLDARLAGHFGRLALQQTISITMNIVPVFPPNKVFTNNQEVG